MPLVPVPRNATDGPDGLDGRMGRTDGPDTWTGRVNAPTPLRHPIATHPSP